MYINYQAFWPKNPQSLARLQETEKFKNSTVQEKKFGQKVSCFAPWKKKKMNKKIKIKRI
jgi:hypothetical protein